MSAATNVLRGMGVAALLLYVQLQQLRRFPEPNRFRSAADLRYAASQSRFRGLGDPGSLHYPGGAIPEWAILQWTSGAESSGDACFVPSGSGSFVGLAGCEQIAACLDQATTRLQARFFGCSNSTSRYSRTIQGSGGQFRVFHDNRTGPKRWWLEFSRSFLVNSDAREWSVS